MDISAEIANIHCPQKNTRPAHPQAMLMGLLPSVNLGESCRNKETAIM